jgi:hypothetical protein
MEVAAGVQSQVKQEYVIKTSRWLHDADVQWLLLMMMT